jgi:hypothetical protein
MSQGAKAGWAGYGDWLDTGRRRSQATPDIGAARARSTRLAIRPSRQALNAGEFRVIAMRRDIFALAGVRRPSRQVNMAIVEAASKPLTYTLPH